MDNPDYLGLYQAYLERLKPVGSEPHQYIGNCPFHDDKTPSFAVNVDNGLCHCFVGCFDGNAYQFADKIGHPNPKQFINGESAEYKAIDGDTSAPDLEKMIHPLVENLLGTPDMIPECWDEKYIKQLGVGYKDDEYYFSHHDIHGNIIAIHKHKSTIIGSGRSKWYLAHLIHTYETNKPLYICEGEKDAISMLSIKLQCISNTTGCASIPKASDGYYDFNPISSFQEVIIVYDNDDAGRKGAERLGRELIKEYPDKTIKIAKWDNDLPDTFDATDSLLDPDDMGDTLFEAFNNAFIVEPIIPKEFGVFNVIRGVDADGMIIKPRQQIIDNLMPLGVCGIIAGTTGANKSILSMQMGMALANDEDSFLNFKINQKGISVLFADTEVGEDILAERYDLLKRNFNWHGSMRFNMLSKQGTFSDIWHDLKKAVRYFKPDVVFIDCLYNTSTEREFSKSHKIATITDQLTELKTQLGITIYAIHHMNKGGHEVGLHKDRMSGASALQNWVEHLILMADTNEDHIRLLKIEKSRVIEYPKCYYALEWNPNKFQLTNRGIVENWKAYMVSADMKIQWKRALEDVSNEFTTIDWRNVVECKMKKSERTAQYWLRQMELAGIINDDGYGKWIKVLEVVENDVE